jgi:hypothetical protein
MKRASFSQKVLDYKKRKRTDMIASVVFFTFIGGFLLSFSVGAYYSYRTYKLTTAPTWADFTINPKQSDTSKQLFETVGDRNEDGVPRTVTINGQLWSIVLVDIYDDAKKFKPGKGFSGKQGETYCENRTISYIRNYDHQQFRVNLMHEIFHAGACLHGGDTWWNSENPTETDHPGIYHLGEFMANFAHDNPKFMEWEAE